MFRTKGDTAQWRVVYGRMESMDIGQVLTDKELAELLPEAAESSRTGAVTRAVKEMQADHKRSFARVRGVGYRMVDAREHENLARVHHRRARRQLQRSQRQAASADRSRLTREERERIDALELNLSVQISATRRLEARVERAEQEMRTIRRQTKSDTATLSARVDKLAEQLARHGITAPTA